MTRQIGVMKYADRKRMFDRVQQLAMEYLPMIPLVTPNVLVGVKKSLGNFRPALLDHNSLWNIEELCWRTPVGGSPK
jgi:ABC-type transport system substrate-binding protein